eukprot:264236_1
MQMLSALCRWSQTIKPFRSRTSTLVFADNAMSILSNQFIVICAVTPCRNHYIDVIECDDDDTESQYFLFLLLLLLLLSSCIRCAIHGMIQMQCHILWPIPRIAMSKLMHCDSLPLYSYYVCQLMKLTIIRMNTICQKV